MNRGRPRTPSWVSVSSLDPDAPASTPYSESMLAALPVLNMDTINDKLQDIPESDASSSAAPESAIHYTTPVGSDAPTIEHFPTTAELAETFKIAQLAVDQVLRTSSAETLVYRADPQKPLQTDGVTEHTDWSEPIEDDLLRALARLRNLAINDYQRDPSLTIEEHYNRRLRRVQNKVEPSYTQSTRISLIEEKTTVITSLLKKIVGKIKCEKDAEIDELLGEIENLKASNGVQNPR